MQQYSPAVDTWAAGILLHAMLAGEVPFDSEAQIKMGELAFYQDIWSAVSADAKARLCRPQKQNIFERAPAPPLARRGGSPPFRLPPSF